MYDLGNGPALGGPQKSRKERRISVLLKRGNEAQHSSGINSVLVAPDTGALYTASRDATVKRWAADNTDTPECSTSYEGHTDWVNDLLLMDGYLVSCSSDRTIKIWDAASEHQVSGPIATFVQHADYVLALAAAPRHNIMASGGLRSQVFLWDLAAGLKVAESDRMPRGMPAKGVKNSVYALSLDADANMLAVGTPEPVIRVIDARTGEKCMKLRGHTDNIRAVLLNAEGTLCLSGSSDQTIRLWDLGQQRCVQTFAVHTDSVWALHATPDFGTVYSGGRDACVYRTQLATRTSELLVEEDEPVLKLSLDEMTGDLWVATTSSTVRCWAAGQAKSRGLAPALATSPPKGSAAPVARAGASSFLVGPSPQIRQRQSFERGNKPSVVVPKASAVIPGLPPIKQFAITADRRHVLTQDAEGNVDLYDMTTAAVVKSFGKADLRTLEKELWRPEAVAPWFTADCKLGSLCVHLEPPTCFTAEIYALDLGCGNAADDIKVNFGLNFLRAAFAYYVGRLAEQHRAHQANGRGKDNEYARAAMNAPPSEFEGWGSSSAAMPFVMGEYDEGDFSRPWLKAHTAFTGNERVPNMIPLWVVEVVLCDILPENPEFLGNLKCAFVLHPVDGSGLPGLLPSRLIAPRVLRMAKVVNYTQAKLLDEGINLSPYCVYWDPNCREALAADQKASGEGTGEMRAPWADPDAPSGELELLCNGMAVPHDLSLAAVRAYMWRRSDDLVLHYRIRRPDSPAPLPNIRPPP